MSEVAGVAAVEIDPFDIRRVRDAPSLLDEFNEIGVLNAADVHVAVHLARLADGTDDVVKLAAAFAVRAPRLGHVYVDLSTISGTATVDSEEPVDLSGLPWPEPAEWVAEVEKSSLVSVGDGDPSPGEARPLRLVGNLLYLDRYWREERQIARDLIEFAELPAPDIRTTELGEGIVRLFRTKGDLLQEAAAATAVLRRFSVIAGGPGTGKTTTVARMVALIAEQAEAAGAPRPVVAMAAPTAKAAQRLTEAVRKEAATLEVSDSTRDALLALEGVTLHRLLGWRPRSHSRYRHDRTNRLPHDVVIVDETSMVSLTMMARLVEAVRRDARLILIGDPGQLTSIEAGAVLGDVVGPATESLRMSVAAQQELGAVCGRILPAQPAPPGVKIGDGTIVLDTNHRSKGTRIAELSAAIRRGEEDAALFALGDQRPGITWIDADIGDPSVLGDLQAIRAGATATARAMFAAARRRGGGEKALEALGRFRILCAHRRGDYGAETWNARVEGWLAEEIDGFGLDGPWYVGRPLLVTRNDYGVKLFNGDTGIVVADGSGVTAEFGDNRKPVRPSRLEAVETVYAMTIHKSQGSQFDTTAVLLPPPASPILTRELLYTAVTRASKELILVGTEESVRAAIGRPVARASGLRVRLWGDEA